MGWNFRAGSSGFLASALLYRTGAEDIVAGGVGSLGSRRLSYSEKAALGGGGGGADMVLQLGNEFGGQCQFIERSFGLDNENSEVCYRKRPRTLWGSQVFKRQQLQLSRHLHGSLNR